MKKFNTAQPARSLLATVLLGLGLGLAAPVTLTLNGQPTTLNTTVIGGTSYIRLNDLKTALAASGGANQKASLEGCVNEWLFNGIWRFRVKGVQRVQDRDYGEGWGVTVEIKNGTAQTLEMDDAGIAYNGAVNLAFPDGNSWAKGWRSGWQDKTYAKLPQGTGTLYTFKIFPESRMDAAEVDAYRPNKFLFDVTKEKRDSVKAGFTTADPSFRVNLTCQK